MGALLLEFALRYQAPVTWVIFRSAKLQDNRRNLPPLEDTCEQPSHGPEAEWPILREQHSLLSGPTGLLPVLSYAGAQPPAGL